MPESEQGIVSSTAEREIHFLKKELIKTIKRYFHPVILALALCICPGDDIFAMIAASTSATQIDQQIIIPENPRLERSEIKLDLKV